MRIAIYAGTFDPITYGHTSVIERAARCFDRLIVVVAVNPEKRPLFSESERVFMIRDSTRPHLNVDCCSTEGLVVELAKRVGASFLVRGVRSSTDVEAEIALANINYELAPEIATVFIPAEPTLSAVSSSRLKELAISGNDISVHCPSTVAALLKERLSGTVEGKVAHGPF